MMDDGGLGQLDEGEERRSWIWMRADSKRGDEKREMSSKIINDPDLLGFIFSPTAMTLKNGKKRKRKREKR